MRTAVYKTASKSIMVPFMAAMLFAMWNTVASAWTGGNYFWRPATIYWASYDFTDGPSQGACGGVMPDYSRGQIREAARRWSWPESRGPYFYISEHPSNSLDYAQVVVQCRNLTQDFGAPYWAGLTVPTGAYDDYELYKEHVNFNSDTYYYSWNLGATCYGSNNCGLIVVAIHELGHVAQAGHSTNPSEVMYEAPRDTVWVTDQDARGAIHSQGMASVPNPDTEPQRRPLQNWLEMSNGVWSAAAYYQVATYPPAVDSGGRYVYITGTPDQCYSFAYNKLYDLDDQPWAGEWRGIRIRPGLRLEWWQFNYNVNGANQYQMSVELKLIDDAGNVSWARDSGLLDNNRINMHPAARPNWGGWQPYHVSLDPVAGKRIIGIYAAFDNGSNCKTGPYRGLFENIAIFYRR